MIEAEHGGIQFVDFDNDGVPEIEVADWRYAYEFASYAESFAPDVVLRFQDGRYVVAPELMATPAFTDEELIDLAATVREAYREADADGKVTVTSPAGWGNGGGALWNAMVGLIYTGHEDQARQLFQLAWPEGADGKRRALRNFAKIVASSSYYQELANAPRPPAGLSEYSGVRHPLSHPVLR